MSIQISVDPTALSKEQREAVAGFILAFPANACAVAEIPAFIHKDTADAGLVELGKHVHAAPVSDGATTSPLELATLQHDHESTLPEAAFGQVHAASAIPSHEAAAAFGIGKAVDAPLVLSTPAIAAASTVAPPPPANTAPITTTLGVASSAAPANSTASNSGVDLDAKGMPWDNRIHAESKGKIADGTWRKKRNLDPTVLATVEAELRQLMGAPVVPLVPTTAPIAPTPPLVPAAPVTANLPTASVSQPVAASLPPAAPQAPVVGEVPADARAQFVALVGRASAAIQGQKVTQAEVNQCCADAGVPALPLLANRLDLVAQVAAHIDALIAARQ